MKWGAIWSVAGAFVMKIFWLKIIFLLCIPFVAKAQGWTQLEEGADYQRLAVAVTGQTPVILHVFKIDPQKFVLRPIQADGTSTAKKMVEKTDALLALNANFFDTDEHALGLVVIDGHESHSVKQVSWWGVFCVKNRQARIFAARDYRRNACDEAVQAGPRLVVAGGMPTLKDETSRKTAVGVRSDGTVIVAVSEGALPIKALAATFRRPESQGGLNCPNALNLDGGSSSQLYARFGRFKIDVPSFVRVPVGLGVFRR